MNLENAIWYNHRQRFELPRSVEPAIDEEISRIVGKKIYKNDPRLLKLVVKWKKEKGKPENSNEPDNFLKDSKKLEELRKELNGELK